MRATVCLPTYNELANLEPMLRALGGVLRAGDRVLVIDDSSPDGTGELADRLAAELDFVDVLHRERQARASAPPTSPGFATRSPTDAELILEIDCDFSHDPADVPRLIAAAEDGADLVLGSRYVPGGSRRELGARPPRDLPGRRALHRRSSCRWAYATRPAASSASADGCSRRSTSTRSTRTGYAFQIETTYRAKRAGFRVVELPIRFADRERGRSKMSRAIVLEAIWRVPLLRLQLR